MAEEYYQLPKDPQYSINDIRKLQTSDPANAVTVFNPLFLRVLENIAAVHNGAAGAETAADAAAKAAAEAAAAALAAANAASTAQQTANTAQQTASNANTAAANAKSAADTAQSTANSAATAAAKAQSTADSAPQIATGSYSGSNSKSKTISVGFKPLLMIITSDDYSSSKSYFVIGSYCFYAGQSNSEGYSGKISFSSTDSGLTISATASSDAMNYSGKYSWVAIG